MKRPHRSYHPHFKYLVLFEDPFGEFKRMIPKSTYHDWVNNGTGFYFGEEFAHQVSAEKIELFRSVTSHSKLYRLMQAVVIANKFLKSVIRELISPRKFNVVFREKILSCLDKLKSFVSQENALGMLGKTRHFLEYVPDNRICQTSDFAKCFIKYPLQLSAKEQRIIKQYLSDAVMKRWQKISVYWQLRKDNLVHCSKTSFYRHAKKLGFGGFKKQKKITKSKFPKAKCKFDIIHMDTSHFTIGNQKFYIYLVVDNFTRGILAYRLENQNNSWFALKNLLAAIRKYKHLYFLITDGGSENKGYVSRFLNLSWVLMNRKIAYSDLYTTNATVELIIKQLKSYHITVNGNETLDEARKILDAAVIEYMNKPLDVHYGQSAQEILNDQFANTNKQVELIQQAKKKRVEENRKFKCDLCKSV